MTDFGNVEGETCWRNGCQGVIAEHAVENCSCHINPPCSSCTTDRSYCPECDYVGADEDERLNDHIMKYNPNIPPVKGYRVFESWKPRPLDPRKLDWRSAGHANSSMIKEGVYPLEMERAEVEKAVRGTFGGRFEYFRDGKFKYIAYTD